MTDEEMAEDYAKGLCKTCTVDTCRYSTIQTCAIKESIKQAHFDGLKAGRPKFHKIAFEGLPTDSRGQTYVVVDEYDCCMLASLDNGVWHNYHDIENVVAWCEVPKFSE